MGEGWGEGEKIDFSASYPPPLCPLPPGEGNFLTFYETIKINGQNMPVTDV
jgi:hypothetical protein